MSATTSTWLDTFKTAVADAILPPLCVTCKDVVVAQGALCVGCWNTLNFVGAAQCRRCGIPFDTLDGDATSLDCEMCTREPPVFSRARAPLVYDDASRSLIIRIKHQDELHIVPTLMPFLQHAGRELLACADVLVPVPLARWRLFNRRYNQAALMVNALAKDVGIPALSDGLLRTRETPTQGGLDRKERQKNVRDAFTINPRYADFMHGKAVVLVDDVLTTGATANECAKALLAAGAARVDVLTFARVPLSR